MHPSVLGVPLGYVDQVEKYDLIITLVDLEIELEIFASVIGMHFSHAVAIVQSQIGIGNFKCVSTMYNLHCVYFLIFNCCCIMFRSTS